MNVDTFRKAGHELIDWMADYMNNVSDYPVTPKMNPGDIKKQLPNVAPENAESFDTIFSDFKNIIVPGMTHWQHPRFFAYLPTGYSPPSILGDMLSSSLGAQCMMWITSPSAEELEERMMEWLREMLCLPSEFTGVIHDTSSSSNLIALLVAREVQSAYAVNRQGFDGKEKFRVYASTESHSSVDKAVCIAGVGYSNLIKVKCDENFEMDADALKQAIEQDIAMGFVPLCVFSTMGTTNSVAIDPIKQIGELCKKYHCWHHVDASYAGTALMLPEMRWMSKGIELADSFVFNPHKWMLTNFDCSVFFVRDKKALIKAFSITPSYLETMHDGNVNNYRDWGIPLGRRFRSLKLWFVIRTYGVEGIRNILREHIRIGQWFKKTVEQSSEFEILSPSFLTLVCFRYRPPTIRDEAYLNEINTRLVKEINQRGDLFLISTQLNKKVAIRFISSNYNASLEEVKKSWKIIKSCADHVLDA